MKHRVTIATHFVIASVAAVMASCPGLPEPCPAQFQRGDHLRLAARMAGEPPPTLDPLAHSPTGPGREVAQ